MKSATNRIVIALVITVMTGVLAFANNKERNHYLPDGHASWWHAC